MRKAMFFAAAAQAALLVATPATAQESGTEDAPEAGDVVQDVPPTVGTEIVVTAQRRSESINDVPLSVQAFSGDALRDLRVDNVQSLATNIPSLAVAPAYSGVPIFTLRGIGFNSVNITATSTVGIYQDELALPYPSMANGPIFDLERVEVLKGPQGLLYGRNTTAGLVDFITAKPKLGEFSGYATAEIGNYQTYNFEGALNIPLGRTAALRASFRSENSDEGWQIDQSRGEKLGEKDRLGGRLSLLWEPSSSFEAFASVSGWRDRSDTQAGQAISLNLTNRLSLAAPAVGPGDFNSAALLDYLANNQPDEASDAGFQPAADRAADVGLAPGIGAPRADSEFLSAQLRLTLRPDAELSIISLTGYNNFTRKDVVDFGGAPFEIISTEYDAKIESFSQELRFEGDHGDFSWSVGGYYAHDDLREGSRFVIGDNSSVAFLRANTLAILANPALNALFNVEGHTPADVAVAFREGGGMATGYSETYSGYANADFQLSDQFSVSGGVRFGKDYTELDGCSTEVNGNYLPIVNTTNRVIIFQTYGVIAPLVVKGGCTTYDPTINEDVLVHEELNEDNFSGRLTLQYEPADATMLFASVARGVKSGNIPIVPANRAVQFTPAKQEELTAYEIGIKTAIADRLAQVNVTGFYYDYTDKQFSSYVPDPTFGALQRLVNIPNSHAWGIDAEVTLRPSPVFQLQWNGTYLKTKVEDYVGANAAGIPTDFSGSEFSYAPEFSTSATATLTLPVSSSLNFQATLNGSYRTETHSDFGEDPLFRIKDYALLNGSMGIASADGLWSVTIWGRNITDTYYWTSVVDNQNLNVRYAGMPRTFGASFSVNF
ncbi:TonB-dependent receptor [Stakelama tenebrarum]|uniref:TonB-dependent receptor n=1 Tax=Stakelama tenebrarum TaxID=2711215 RepID=A0A6G6Y8D9_9SPHN|nr:TonB-dependent receptor [Sphingosinithalassobacter tenebrarum]QIG81067.1 TonB-dependent receptor [Sphingosinithalassobacter tenebrarum]